MVCDAMCPNRARDVLLMSLVYGNAVGARVYDILRSIVDVFSVLFCKARGEGPPCVI